MKRNRFESRQMPHSHRRQPHIHSKPFKWAVAGLSPAFRSLLTCPSAQSIELVVSHTSTYHTGAASKPSSMALCRNGSRSSSTAAAAAGCPSEAATRYLCSAGDIWRRTNQAGRGERASARCWPANRPLACPRLPVRSGQVIFGIDWRAHPSDGVGPGVWSGGGMGDKPG